MTDAVQPEDQQAGPETCSRAGHDQPRMVGPYDYHCLSVPPGRTREDWADHILARLAAGEDCPPF